MCEAPDESVPPELLRMVAKRSGGVTLVVGAGCSVEAPTSLKLSRDYAVEIHDQLVADGVLSPGECNAPEDLSELAEHVYRKTGSQAGVVNRFPLNKFRNANPNDGHYVAVLLLEEGAFDCIVTLNFDLALTNAVRDLGLEDTSIIEGSETLSDLGTKSIIYLHGNVNVTNRDSWALRRDVLEDHWESGWQELIMGRAISTPVLVFAGLGSPAAVLTDSVKRLNTILGNESQVVLADPLPFSQFASQLELSNDNLVKASWTEFMNRLGQRVVDACLSGIGQSAEELYSENTWELPARLPEILAAVADTELPVLGRVRASWSAVDRKYMKDNTESRQRLAYLLGAITELVDDLDFDISLARDGLLILHKNGRIVWRIMGLHGRGMVSWSQAEDLMRRLPDQYGKPPDLVVAGGMIGSELEAVAPPSDIVVDNFDADDIVSDTAVPRLIDFEKYRGTGANLASLGA